MAKNQKTNRDHAKKHTKPMVEDSEIASQISALLTPAITSQENYYRQLGLRGRILNLPLMVAAVLTLLWRDVSGVTELTRMLARSGFLWCRPTTVTQQAMSQRFLSLPATLFEGVFKNLLPILRTAWHQRNQRPLPESIQFTLRKFSRIWIVDSSTLEALFCKLKSHRRYTERAVGRKNGNSHRFNDKASCRYLVSGKPKSLVMLSLKKISCN